MKKLILKIALVTVFCFSGFALSAQRVDLVINGTCACCSGGGMSVYLSFSGGSTSASYSVTPGSSVTCIVIPVGNTVTDVTFTQGTCTFSLGGVNITSATCGLCSCGCLNSARTFSSSYAIGGGTICPPTADVITVTVN